MQVSATPEIEYYSVISELTPILLAAARRTIGVSSVHRHLNILREKTFYHVT